MMRIATKYPRIAERYFEATGRQAEVIEVKGSVELAPLVGLADGIVDLVATGRTLEENDLEVREEIVDCTARLVANRVAHKLRAAEIDELTGEAAGGERRDEDRGASSGTGGRRPRRRDPRLGRGVGADAGRRRGRSRREVRRAAATRRCSSLTERFDATEQPAELAAGRPGRGRRRPSAALDPELREALELAAANIRAVAEAQLGDEPRDGRAAAGPDGDGRARSRSAPPASTRPAAGPPIPRAS